MLSLKMRQVVQSPSSGTRYRIDRPLGAGGFGRVYLAYELNRKNRPVDEVCLKTTLDQSSWHRESYFGELLSRSKRVIQLLDSFPLAPRVAGRGRMLYCLVLELAEHGTVVDHLKRTGKPWSTGRVKREICALLKVLDQLHGGSATHRDITPMNIFVCGNGTLKLGDFGIARHQLASGPVTIDAFNPAYVTRGFLDESHRHWLAADDVYQMGQLLAMLLSGVTESMMTAGQVRQLDCDEQLKAVIKRAIGPRGKRFADAFEMLQALRGEGGPSESRLRSLVDKRVVFSGPLSLRRFDAEVMVLQAGGKVGRQVSRNTDVVVQGGRLPHHRGGHKGSKLQQAEKLIKKGVPITMIGEAEFRRLVRDATVARAAQRRR